MGTTRTVKWDKVDQVFSGLKTELVHEIRVQREAIPLVFVPGIMGTRLRVAGTDGKGKGADTLPNLRWDPSSTWFMLKNFFGADPQHRMLMLVGPDDFSSGFLEVDDANPVSNGFHGIFDQYCNNFLNPLIKHDWGALRKIFEFPVYAVGYNWTDSNENSGKRLASRITAIIAEAKGVTGLCEKVILITHSMGGLVSRAASELHDAKGKILGIVHGVQPASGSPAAYWRIKGGFEGKWSASMALGHSGPEVAPVLGNIPGGLELLPNKLYRTNPTTEHPDGLPGWLNISGVQPRAPLPKSDPYEEIYRVKARVLPTPGEKPSTNKFWGLVDPDLLDPHNASQLPASGPNAIDTSGVETHAWNQYKRVLDIAEKFHDKLGKKAHPLTFCFRGFGFPTVDSIELRTESNREKVDPYPSQGFRGYFTDAAGNSMRAVLQNPAGDGDGTVPLSSAGLLNDPARPAPGDSDFPIEHQPAYNDSEVQRFVVQGILALVKHRYEERRGAIGDFPASKSANRGA
jgi:pimeloyl-ACP methyl ester carboxylesterase